MSDTPSFADYWRDVHGPTTRCKRGERLRMEPPTIAVVLRGMMALEASYADGSIAWLAVLRAGSAARMPRFGDFLCDGALVAQIYGTEVGRVGRAALRGMPRELRSRLVNDLLRTSETVLRFSAARSQGFAPNRVLAVLMELSDIEGDIGLSQEALGLLAGTTRETVNRILQMLNRSAATTTSNRAITILRRDAIAELLISSRRIGWHDSHHRLRLKAGTRTG